MCALLRNANKKFNATHSTLNFVCNAAVVAQAEAVKARRMQSCLDATVDVCVCVCVSTRKLKKFVCRHTENNTIIIHIP